MRELVLRGSGGDVRHWVRFALMCRSCDFSAELYHHRWMVPLTLAMRRWRCFTWNRFSLGTYEMSSASAGAVDVAGGLTHGGCGDRSGLTKYGRRCAGARGASEGAWERASAEGTRDGTSSAKKQTRRELTTVAGRKPEWLSLASQVPRGKQTRQVPTR